MRDMEQAKEDMKSDISQIRASNSLLKEKDVQLMKKDKELERMSVEER